MEADWYEVIAEESKAQLRALDYPILIRVRS
jgi:hypothetical protein